MRRDLVDQRLPHQLVPKPVAGIVDDEDAGAQAGVEPSQRLRFRRAGERGRGGGIEALAGQRESLERVDDGRLEVDEAGDHRIARGLAEGRDADHLAACQLQAEERVAFTQLDDAGDGRARPRRGAGRLDQGCDLGAVQRRQLQLDQAPRSREAIDRPPQDRRPLLRACRRESAGSAARLRR